MPFISIEIKARCENRLKLQKILEHEQADYRGTDHQVDTYFNTPNGRLKLREGNIENYLIHYSRPNQVGPKKSKVILYKPNPESTLKDLLIAALGVKVVVDKQRQIFFIDNVKFHLDEVKDLGTFVEIEALDKKGNIGQKKLEEQCQEYLDKLGIKDLDLLEGSYSDMIAED